MITIIPKSHSLWSSECTCHCPCPDTGIQDVNLARLDTGISNIAPMHSHWLAPRHSFSLLYLRMYVFQATKTLLRKQERMNVTIVKYEWCQFPYQNFEISSLFIPHYACRWIKTELTYLYYQSHCLRSRFHKSLHSDMCRSITCEFWVSCLIYQSQKYD